MPENTIQQNSTIATMDFKVTGMHCGACVNRVEQSLRKLDGVESAEVNLAGERAHVRYQPGKVSKDGMIAAIADAGYKAEPL